MGARYYDPKLARFISADTIVPMPFYPQTLNRYAYCYNNPIMIRDLDGHAGTGFWSTAWSNTKSAVSRAWGYVKSFTSWGWGHVKSTQTYCPTLLKRSFKFSSSHIFPNEAGTAPLRSRCSLCNTLLEDIHKDDAKPHVPEYVYQTSDTFKQCPKCAKFYWEGTHQDKIRKKLMEIIHQQDKQ